MYIAKLSEYLGNSNYFYIFCDQLFKLRLFSVEMETIADLNSQVLPT